MPALVPATYLLRGGGGAHLCQRRMCVGRIHRLSGLMGAQGCRIGHLDRPYGDWPRAVTSVPWQAMRLPGGGCLHEGASADFIIFRGRRYSELMSRPQHDRVRLRGPESCIGYRGILGKGFVWPAVALQCCSPTLSAHRA